MGSLLFLVVFIYAVLGMNLFPYVMQARGLGLGLGLGRGLGLGPGLGLGMSLCPYVVQGDNVTPELPLTLTTGRQRHPRATPNPNQGDNVIPELPLTLTRATT